LVVFEELKSGLVEHAARVGDYFRQRLEGLGVGRVKGRGLMLGLELERPCRELVLRGLEEGLVFNCTAERVLRFLPPLIISEEEVDRAAEALRRILS
ncbi:MAG: aminotransferase class III-fold pyridoxal phosphate-dependent enzyme, partial [Aquificae bacterium]|nr:aminotransferase class III-fold pyridoxal phosphate-dependent enzyme [Aquificota bacterium]